MKSTIKTLAFIILSFVSVISKAQTQIGSDIIGDNPGDLAGNVALSKDGTTLAVGAYMNSSGKTQNGQVRVFRSISGAWIQIGSDIIGEVDNERSGEILAISSDGEILAIGSRQKNSGAGQVKVFRYNPIPDSWTQIGTDINGDTAGDNFGRSISLSHNGNIISIGAVYYDTPFRSAGQVKIFENIADSWIQIGSDILGESDSDYSYNVSLSSDGSTVAIGAARVDVGDAGDIGYVRIFKNTSGTWVQVGLNIIGESGGDLSGSTVSLSANGSIVAIGATRNSFPGIVGRRSGHVRVYEFNSGSSSWIQMGQDIDGVASEDAAGYVSTSDNGLRIAVGAPYNDDNDTDAGHVKIYDYDAINSVWTQIGTNIEGSTGDQVGRPSLSGDGSVLAIGSYKNDNINGVDAGYAKIYAVPTSGNSAPTNISLSSSSVNENVSIGTTLGALLSTDSDSGDTHTYTLVSGTGDTDNASFTISGANLLTNTALDYETKNSYSIVVQTSDGTATYSKTFAISVIDVDEDSDGDGITNNLDNCPSTANADQADTDGDGIGDVCDNAPNISNANQLDTDGDGEGDVSDTDDDGDGVADSEDAFPLDASESADTDGDGVGDSADPDLDNDGILDTVDNCLYTPNADQLDTDADGIGNVCDSDDDGDGFSDADEITCSSDPLLASSLPADTDSDGIANCIDTDDDGDGYLDTDEIACGSDPLLASSKPLDTDNDGIANCIDTDDDNDSYLDENDAFPLDDTEWLDTDADGTGNNADTDDDNDGQTDDHEMACGSDPLLASSMSLDTDGDTIPDCVDTDDDNDGVIDTADAFPLDPAEWADTDADGIGNNADLDDDNDGQSDYNELVCGSDPLDQYSKSSDIDSDSIPDCVDEDKDGDGYLNEEDAFPEDANEWIDTDGDGLGDNFEVDDDNDGYLDTNDAFPLDPNEWLDTDADGIGDNADPDDNNDGFEDDKLFSSGVLTPGSGGLESTWKVINIERYPNARVTIYNKNGQEVFSTTNYKNNWRGTFKNSANPLPAGSYYYVIDLNNGQDQIKGWLYITY